MRFKVLAVLVSIVLSLQSLPLGPLELTGPFLRTWGWKSGATGTGAALDSSGNIYLTGEADSATDSSRVLLLKYNQTGSLVWQKIWGGGYGFEAGYGVAVDRGGNIYIVGSTTSLNPWHVNQAFLLKFNPAGSLVWQKAWGNFTYAYGVALSPSGEIYVTGSMDSLNNSRALTLLKFDSDGRVLWQKAWTGNFTQEGFGMVTDSTGSIYISGYTTSYDVQSPNGSTAFYSCGQVPCADGLLLKFDPTGSLQWQVIWRRVDVEGTLGRSVAIDLAGNLVVGGWTVIQLGPQHALVTGMVSKFGGNGSLLWQRTWDDNITGPTNTTSPYNRSFNDTRINGIGADPSGDIYAVGSDSGNLFLMRLDPYGRRLSQTLLTGQISSGDGAAVTFDSFGTSIVVGDIHDAPWNFHTIILNQTLNSQNPITTVPAGILRDLKVSLVDLDGTASDVYGSTTYYRGSEVWLNHGISFAVPPVAPPATSPLVNPLATVMLAIIPLAAIVVLLIRREYQKEQMGRQQSPNLNLARFELVTCIFSCKLDIDPSHFTA